MRLRSIQASVLAALLAGVLPSATLAAGEPSPRMSSLREAFEPIWGSLQAALSFLGHEMDPDGAQGADSGHGMDPDGAEVPDLGQRMDPNG